MASDSMKAAADLYSKYKHLGFEPLGFPCAQFLNQNPGDDEATTKEACGRLKAEYQLFKLVNVNGDDASPLWIYLRKNKSGFFGEFIKWNFTSFLVDHEGNIVERFSPGINYDDVEKELLPLLKKRQEKFKKVESSTSASPSPQQQPTQVTSVSVASAIVEGENSKNTNNATTKPTATTQSIQIQQQIQQQQEKKSPPTVAADSGMIERKSEGPKETEKIQRGGCCWC
jgi:glutathione peroxidase